MRLSAQTRSFWAFLLLWVLLFGSTGYGCAIPVFQYALQRWEAEAYQVIVFHRGPLSQEKQAIVEVLKKSPLDEQYPGNVGVRTVDLEDQPEKELEQLYRGQSGKELPWMVVMYPQTSANGSVVWSGPLSESAVQAILDSPARRKIAERILEGETAVWVLVESGEEAKDDAAAQVLQTQLARLEKTLVVSGVSAAESASQDDVSMEAGADGPERPSFSLVRVSRGERSERVFVKMLMGSEGDLKAYTKEPIAFAVFGRGRALYALVGKGINKDNIEEACAFLCGPCAC